jgi:transcriptional regulator with XRE-family HTH domain
MPRPKFTAPLASLGYAVHLQRARLRISQDQTAKRAGMHRNYVGAIERGEINPTYETLLRLAEGLGVPLHKLVQEATSTRSVVPVQGRSRQRTASRA